MKTCRNCGRFDGKCWWYFPPKKVKATEHCEHWLGLCNICAKNTECKFKKPFSMQEEHTCEFFELKEEMK